VYSAEVLLENRKEVVLIDLNVEDNAIIDERGLTNRKEISHGFIKGFLVGTSGRPKKVGRIHT